ncbi:biotin--[acetyl-CoA-carboxylase] ligase [Oscillatoria sp. FACHB-1407]|uniref:biotin--[acetyl-CoA-carboxylase] ligase n=1 Tax=Oscillatoria sp. FACHB-1407 TaxID=2692847 RepID=UPI00168570F1|nr:biotin--[acetyl-CoA-carboxylase] ligase [Oscillatoria sp. FACHB-1407]MBD2462373.1 biotin--[acetyl-CoA-carboxylase] ligase [Oscillatoria sp. FACHB-1407]
MLVQVALTRSPSLNLDHLTTLLDQIIIPAIPDLSSTAFKIHWFETLTSTNQTLWELLAQGSDQGTVAIALQQQGGRGQWGRQWQSPQGGLYLSLALTPNLAVEQGAQLTLCSAWGIATALRHYGIPVELKWLNDLVVQGRKLGGILTETRISQGVIRQAIVGVGINWANPVPAVGINLQTVMATQPQPTITSLEMLAAIALRGMMGAYYHWQNQGIEAILSEYHTLLTSVGLPVRVGDCLGIVTGVSATGDLRVRLSGNGASATDILVKPGEVCLGYDLPEREPATDVERLN